SMNFDGSIFIDSCKYSATNSAVQIGFTIMSQAEYIDVTDSYPLYNLYFKVADGTTITNDNFNTYFSILDSSLKGGSSKIVHQDGSSTTNTYTKNPEYFELKADFETEPTTVPVTAVNIVQDSLSLKVN